MTEMTPERPVPGTGELAEMVYGPYADPESQDNQNGSQQLAAALSFYNIAVCESNHDQILYWETRLSDILDANPHLREHFTSED